MIQISFHPAFDPLHAVLRILRVRAAIFPVTRLELERIRILDFFLMFPHFLDAVRLKPEHKRLRNQVVSSFDARRPYGALPDRHVLFERMAPMQLAALEILGEKGLVEKAKLIERTVSFSESPAPRAVQGRVDVLNEKDASLMSLTKILATQYQFLGADGLKGRTGLLEFRYDAV